MRGITHPKTLLTKDFWQEQAQNATDINPGGILPENLERIGKTIAPIALSFIPVAGPAIAAGYSAVNSFGNSGNLGQAALSGAMNYYGGKLGAEYGSSLGTIGSAAGKAGVNLGYTSAGNSLGSSIGNAIGEAAPGFAANVANTSIGGVLGSYAANNLSSGVTNAQQEPAGMTGPTPFSPSQEAAQNAPASLSAMGSLTNEQQSTSLANQGVYGGGNGPDEQSYFLNLLNRRLVDTGGNVQSNAQVAPIEQSYLQRIGINAGGDSSNLLEAINRWRQTQAQAA